MNIDDLREYYDNNDQSAALAAATWETSTVDEPMVGITVRLPATTLNAAREVAESKNLRVTALIRQWIEDGLAEQTDDARTVTVAELRRLIARAG
jgi:hypothetical protein